MNIIISSLYHEKHDFTIENYKLQIISIQRAFSVNDNSILCKIDNNTILIITQLQHYGSTKGVLTQLATNNFFNFGECPAAIIQTTLPFDNNTGAYRKIQMFLSMYDRTLQESNYKDIEICDDLISS